MKLKTLALLCSTVFPLAGHAADAQAERYIVTFSQGDSVAYKGEYAANFPHGLPVGA